MSTEQISTTITLHPLAVSSICDHYTRVKTGGSVPGGTSSTGEDYTIGILFGVRGVSRNDKAFLCVLDAIDLLITDDIEAFQVDASANVQRQLSQKITLVTTVFPTHELVGWYAVGTVQEGDVSRYIDFQRAFMKLILEPVFLMLNPVVESSSKRLPLTFYRWNTSTEGFLEAAFKLESLDSERIAVDEVFASFPLQGMSAMEAQNASMSTSLETMMTSIKTLTVLLTSMKQKEVPLDHDLLRRVVKLSHQFPTQDEIRDRCFAAEMDRSAMLTCLATYTKSLTIASDLAAKFSTAYTSDWANSSNWGHQQYTTDKKGRESSR